MVREKSDFGRGCFRAFRMRHEGAPPQGRMPIFSETTPRRHAVVDTTPLNHTLQGEFPDFCHPYSDFDTLARTPVPIASAHNGFAHNSSVLSTLSSLDCRLLVTLYLHVFTTLSLTKNITRA